MYYFFYFPSIKPDEVHYLEVLEGRCSVGDGGPHLILEELMVDLGINCIDQFELINSEKNLYKMTTVKFALRYSKIVHHI